MSENNKNMFLPVGLALVLFFIPIKSYAANYIGFSCAPWDGRTFAVETNDISVVIWMRGLDDLMSGSRKIVLDNKGVGGDNPDATGRATLKNTGASWDPDVQATIYFDTLDLKTGGRASGYIETKDGKKFSFSGNLAQPGKCG
jgi:hypothetical protein